MKHRAVIRRRICSAMLIATLGCIPPMVIAADTGKPVRLVVPSAAGGTPDLLMRLLTAEITKGGGPSFVVDNKPGASGIIGINELLRAPADGSTMAYVNNVTLAINTSMFKKLPYDPQKLTPVVLIGKIANVIAINPALPINNYAELIAYAKANPDKLTYASPGQGTSGHLSGELLSMTAGVKMRHIAYKGSPQAVSDVLGGQVDIMIDNTATILPYLKQGRLRPLAITSLSRMPQLPDVPTVAETGLAGFEGVAWAGLALPPGASAATAQALNAAVNKAMAAPELQNKYREMGMEITVTNNPQDLMTYAAKETVKWAEVIKRAGIEPQAL